MFTRMPTTVRLFQERPWRESLPTDRFPRLAAAACRFSRPARPSPARIPPAVPVQVLHLSPTSQALRPGGDL